jgi:lysophospholipase L1-like esterase
MLFTLVVFQTFFLRAQVTDTILNRVGDKPFYFSVPGKDGNYRVTVTLGAKDKASKTVVRAESRRLMVENCTTKRGQFETYTFIVNKRTAEIGRGKKVSLKPRELDYLNWDNLLTLEFNGSAPAVQSIRIEPDTTTTTIFLCGNSTVVDQEAEPYASWGQMIPRWFTDKVAISNHAESGLTARTFIAGHRLEKVLSMLKKGDYVFCEFGHNDQKEHQPGDGAWYHFQYQLKQFVDQVRKAGGNLIFVTPTQRRRFDDATHTKILETHDDYPDAMRDVAKREGIPVIELHEMTRIFFETLGFEGSKKALVHYPANTFPGQEKALEDNTHFNPYGAYEVAKMVVMEMKQLGLPLVQHLRKDWQDFDPRHPDNPETFQWYPADRQDATRPDGDTEKSAEQPTSSIPKVTWDQQSLIIDGRRVVPAMGEVHYSRIPAPEWERAVQQIKEGGITMLACYVFWNHIEEIEGQFDWSGQRSLRRFLEVCKAGNMPVVLRIGPYCHGEVRGGGIPDWVVKTGCKLRTQDKVFLGLVEKLYRQIFTQVQGLQWKDGGPVIAAQFDNEYGGDGVYLMTLKGMAKSIGFDLPFYTFTGWPGLRKPVPYGEMLPLYGDYADGFWDRGIEEGCGKYYKAFNFRSLFQRPQGGEAMGALDSAQNSSPKGEAGKGLYPYFTCELGGGMMTSYHRRIYTYPEDAYAMAVVKLGSNSNLLGYYMYHGGTNPEGKLGVTLNEQQRTLSTNWNDLPAMTYDFQAPLNEFGQRNPHFYMLRKLHLFMQDYGEVLAPMTATYPCEQDIKQGDDSHLRWSYRSQEGAAFVFINNYERFANLTAKENVQFDVCGVKFPQKPMTIPGSTSCIFPVNIDGIRYATAQLIAHRDGKIYLEQISGVPTEIAIDGKVLRNLKAYGPTKPVYKNIYLLTSEQAGHLFLEEKAHVDVAYVPPVVKKIREAGTPRQITIGVAKVAEEPVDADFEQAAVYQIALPSDSSLYTPHSSLLEIKYRGDVARLYANGRLIDDNFYNGRPFQYALWRLPKGCRQLELRILPLQKDMPVYFPREADFQTPGEEVKSVTIQPLHQ